MPRAKALFPACLLICALALSAAACSFNYGQSGEDQKLEESIPSSVQLNFEHTVVEKSAIIFRLRAGKAEYYSSSKEIRMKNVLFAEYDPVDGQIITTGRADSAVYHNDTKNAELSGIISFYSSRNEARLDADYLVWDDSKRVLAGRSDGTVSILRDDGSMVRGSGFRAEGRKKAFSFSGHTEGVFVTADKPEGATPE